MAKYLVLYNSKQTASETMANASEEQMKASMAEWMTWREDAAGNSIKVDFGMPLQVVTRVTTSGQAASDISVGGYSILEGNKDAILKQLATHPQLKREGASIDVLEMLSMPGLETAQ